MKSKGHVSEFNALVERCACSSDRKEQESYLVRIIMKVMTKRYGEDARIPDATAFPSIVTLAKKDMPTAWKILDAIYSSVSKRLLDDSSFDILDMRAGAISKMYEELNRKQKAKDAAELGVQEWTSKQCQ